jgi:hypothetical protein
LNRTNKEHTCIAAVVSTRFSGRTHRCWKSLPIRLFFPVISCFRNLETREINGLVLISFSPGRTRARGLSRRPVPRAGAACGSWPMRVSDHAAEGWLPRRDMERRFAPASARAAAAE